MYSTSLGNSVMISTSCSRGRQKLRFQISLKVRTARDQGALRGAPEKRVPSRALQRCPHRRAGCGGSPGAPKETATALLRTSRSHPSPRGSVPACRLRTPGGRAAGRQRTGAQPRVQASYRPLPRRSPRGGAALRRPVASLGGAAPTGGAAAGRGAARRRARSRETARSPAPTPSADSPGASALAVPRVSGACREGKAGIVGAARGTAAFQPRAAAPLRPPRSIPPVLTGAGGAPSAPASSSRRKAPSSRIAAPTPTQCHRLGPVAPHMPARSVVAGPWERVPLSRPYFTAAVPLRPRPPRPPPRPAPAAGRSRCPAPGDAGTTASPERRGRPPPRCWSPGAIPA